MTYRHGWAKAQSGCVLRGDPGPFFPQAARLLRRVAQTSRPLVITQNGRPAGGMLSPAGYDRLCARERFLASVAAGAVDAEEGRVMDSDALRTRLAECRRERDTP